MSITLGTVLHTGITSTLLRALVSVVQLGSVVRFQTSFGTQLLAVTQMLLPDPTSVSVCVFRHGCGSSVATAAPSTYTVYAVSGLPPSNPCSHAIVTVNGPAGVMLLTVMTGASGATGVMLALESQLSRSK
jgi:hypothetical protein